MRFAPVLLLVAVATVALSVEGQRHVVKRRSASWPMPLNDEFDEQIGLAFKKYNRVRGSAREWFGPVSLDVEKMKCKGRLGRFYLLFRGAQFGVFSYVKGKQDGKDIVSLKYNVMSRGTGRVIDKNVEILEEGNPYQMFGIMRKFVEEVIESESKRLGLGKNEMFLFRNVMWFTLKKVRGKYLLLVHSRIFINEKRMDHFSEVYDLEANTAEEVVNYLAQYRKLVRSRNNDQYLPIMMQMMMGRRTPTTTTTAAAPTTSSRPPDYKKTFSFKSSTVGFKSIMKGKCVITNHGEVVDTINTIFSFSDRLVGDHKMAEFKENGCPLPDSEEEDKEEGTSLAR